MNEEITLLYEDDKEFTITWNKKDKTSYVLLGMNDYSSYELIDRLDDNIITLDKKLLNRYYNFKIDYVYINNGKEVLLGSSKIFYLDVNEISNLKIRAIESYYGITISIDNIEYYDKYVIYKKNKTKYEMLFETEDFLFNSELLNLDSTYLIEAYKRVNNEYKIRAKSEEFKIKLEKIEKNSDKITISVVVPVYNAEMFVPRCIDSILLSTQKNIEIILVNDCSTDRSIGILRWYRDKYKGIVTLIDSNENEGVSVTRNKGIDSSRGEFTAFLDSDDYIHSSMYENLYNLAKRENLDVCIAKTIIRNNVDDYCIYLNVPYKGIDDVIYTYEEMFNSQHTENNIYFADVCNRIAKTDLIKKVYFPNIRWFEDIAYSRILYSFVDRLGFNHKSYFVWDKRDASIVKTLSKTAGDSNSADYSHEIYFKMIHYIIDNGNKERIDYLVYDCIKDIYDFCTEHNLEENFQNLYKKYQVELLKISEKVKLLDNSIIKNNKDIYKFLTKILRKKK